MMIGIDDERRISRHTSMPDIPGSIRSSSTRSGFEAWKRRRASGPSAATSTPNPSRRSAVLSASR